MRGKRSFKRSRAISILVAAYAGYLLGGWNATALRTTNISAAQMVALRFPQDWGDASATAAPAAAKAASWTMNNAQLALLNPEPMVPAATRQTSMSETAAPQQIASADPLASLPPPAVMPPPQAARAAPQASAIKPLPAPPPVRRPAERPGFILNDAQIASIKGRLNLTPDQEQMWPAVEAALRNLAYSRAHERRPGAREAQLAAADPNSAEVQGLKSAAIPLLMSFNSEQKDEVRSLAHVMGLDQLANEF